MPQGYARPDTATIVWGTLDHGSFAPPPAGTTYAWVFRHDGAVSVMPGPATSLSGSVTDGRNIAVTCTFSLGNGATSARVQAILTVANADGEDRASTWLRVVSNQDPLSDTQEKALDIDRRIAIENALHWLFLRQNPEGSWPVLDAAACTATALWAFENAGYTPDADPAVDVYQPAVKAGLEYILSASEYLPIAATPKGEPDADGNGRGVYLAKNRTPAVASGGLTGDLGVDGYTHAMCLAALCASGTPEYVTHAGPFDNAGAGTPLLDIVQDAVDFEIWKLGRSGSGGWSYAYDDAFWVDMSIASWNYVALEAARQFGAVVPDWAPAWCENLLGIAYVSNKGLFSYQMGAAGPSTASAATTASGLSGLILAADNGRAPGIDAGKMATQTLCRIGALWNNLSQNSYTLLGDTYQMWTVARALRMAGVSRLNTPDGLFDWQRNCTAAGDVHEGFWPYLVRTQKPDGHWRDAGVFHYPDELATAWAVLCLSEGVVGPDAVWHDVEVTASLPADTGNELVAGGFAEHEPCIANDGTNRRLTWFIGNVSEGQSFDLSFDQVLENIVPGEFRTVQNSLMVSCFTRQSQLLEEVRGPLGVSVASSLYSLTVTADQDAYAPGDTARFTVNLDLPYGQAFQRIASPTARSYILEPNLASSAAAWTVLNFDVINPEAFSVGENPVAVRVRSAPSRDTLATTPFSDPITVSGSPLPCPPGRCLELDVALTPNAAGALPQIGFITVWYNTGPARVVLDVLASDDSEASSPAAFSLFPADYGTTLRRVVDWVVHDLAPNSTATVRARLFLSGDSQAAMSTDDFDVTAPDAAGVLDVALAADSSKYPPYTDAVFTAVLRNHDPELTLKDLTIVVDVLDPQGGAPADGHFSLRMPRLAPGEEATRRLTWNTRDHAPGTWHVRQTVTTADGAVVDTSEISVQIGGDLGSSLAGQIDARPRTIVHPGLFDVDWTVENRGNAALRNFRVQLTISPEPGGRNRGWRSISRSVELLELLPGASSTGTWSDLPSSELPEGPYVALLEAVQGRGAPTALDTAPLAVRDRPTDAVPPTTTDDYAFDGAWINHDAHITLTAADNPGGSGVKQTSWTLGGVTTAGTTITVSDQGIWAITFRSEDNAGNVETDNALTVRIDKTPPALTSTLDPAPNANGWNNSSVTVTFTADDALSGVQSVTPPVTVTAEGANQQVRGRAVDAAGNTAALTATINIDKTPPALSVAGVVDGEITNQDVTPVITVTEAHPNAFDLTLDGQPFASGTTVHAEGPHTLRINATDLAGNSTLRTVHYTIDRTPPTTTHDYPFADAWSRQDARITLTAADNPGGSGVKWTSWTLGGVTVKGTGVTVAHEGVSTITFHSEDNAGNVETDNALTVRIDQTPPVVSAALDPAPNANGWNHTDVTVTFTAIDTLSGVRAVTSPITISAEGANQQVQGLATDAAGNAAGLTVPVNLDKTAPTITGHAPAIGSGGVAPDAAISVVVKDTVSGVAPDTLETRLNGEIVPHLFEPGTGLLRIARDRILPDGLNTVEVVVEDAAENPAAAQWSFSVRRGKPAQNPVLFGNPLKTNTQGVLVAGHNTTIQGSIHSNGNACITGRSCRIDGQVTATGRVRTTGGFTGNGRITEHCAARPFPGFASRAYRDRAQFVHNRSLVLRTVSGLPDGIHYVRGDVLILGPVHAHVTIIAEGDIVVVSRNAWIAPHDTENDMLFFSLGRRIRIAGVSNSLTGLIYAPNGRIEVRGRFNRFERARIYGRRVIVTAYRAFILGPTASRGRAAGQYVPFSVDGGCAVPRAPWSGWAEILGDAVSDHGRPVGVALLAGDFRLTPRNLALKPGRDTKVSTSRVVFPAVCEPGTRIAVQARSLQRTTRLRRSWWHRFRSRWTTRFAVDSRRSPENVRVLRSGDPVPKSLQRSGRLPQWLAPMVRNGKLGLPGSKVLFLLELDTRNRRNAQFDNCDLGVLVTLTPPRQEK